MVRAAKRPQVIHLQAGPADPKDRSAAALERLAGAAERIAACDERRQHHVEEMVDQLLGVFASKLGVALPVLRRRRV